MQPMQKYFGVCWPLTLMIYTGDNILWRNKISEMAEKGQKLIDFYKNKQNKIKYENDIQTETRNLQKVFTKIEKTNLQKLANKDLLNLYNQAFETYLNWYALLWTTELVSVRCEEILKEKLAYLSPSEISTLTAITQKSFSQEIEENFEQLLKLAKDKKENFQNQELRKAVRIFQKNYFWIYNNYFDTRILQEEEIILDLKKRLKSQKHNRNFDETLNHRKKNLIKELKLDKETIETINISDDFTYFQDFRKKWIMIFAHYLEVLLKEIGDRAKIPLHDMRYTFPYEIENILVQTHCNTFLSNLKARQTNCLIIFESNAKEGKFYLGAKAKQEEQKILGSQSQINEEIILKGAVACNGKAIGHVKVLMNPTEIYKVNHGDILVTSMTSPDFMAAIRKCVAIITNEGGLTCHAAVIARELNIPCIIGTKNATKVLKDGDKVEVDADKGVVNTIA